MVRRSTTSALTRAYARNLRALTKVTLGAGKRVATQMQQAAVQQNKAPPGPGDWLSGMAVGAAGARRYHLYRPPGLNLTSGEKVPLLVMLHGCGQTGRDLAVLSRMNRLATRERFLVLYPEQDRMVNPHGCWNWYDTRSGKARAEAATLMAAIDQVCLFHPVDRDRIAVAGLSAGASMAVLMATHFPGRFKAVAMHSGVAPGAAQSSATALGAMRGKRAPSVPMTAVGKALGAAAVGASLPPLLVLHGDADSVVTAGNATNTAAVWATATGARPGVSRTLQRGQRRPARITDYTRDGQTRVRLCEIGGLGHAWSGGAARQAFSDPAGPDASKLIWAFVAKQFAVQA
ncbi:extracellular catalytic domain type 1 short-chain-length polyhydroxyalkanoate depolymerase [Variovorax guangxiensis]|uniref:Phospholipase n=1 Tax=Variovorax guangxiensis TaxID=1775474 RepID=A0A502DDI4_9BURK|nr:PHB depolymerase family esterase [Variovorax guangxiensis]RZI68587.1 MAG: PHB depolymerase family esterase [Variovorax sp.]TPG17731.1 phospholipase [Variovorax ginsengisoli]TPG23645.1 phospholipase [Variovorax guangxiensis]